MTWLYDSAWRTGDRVTLVFREPTQIDRRTTVVAKGAETEAEFVARGRGIAGQWLQALNDEQAIATDVTNQFRPTQAGGPGS